MKKEAKQGKEGRITRIKKAALGLFLIAILAAQLSCGVQATQSSKPIAIEPYQTQILETMILPTYNPALLTAIAMIDTPGPAPTQLSQNDEIILNEVHSKIRFQDYSGPHISVERNEYGSITQIKREPPKNPCVADPEFAPDQSIDLRADVCDNYLSIAQQLGLSDTDALQFVSTLALNTVVLSPKDLPIACNSDFAGGCYDGTVNVVFISAEYLKGLGHETGHYLIGQVPDGVHYFDDNETSSCLRKINGTVILVSSTGQYTSHQTVFHPETFTILSDHFLEGQSAYLFDTESQLSEIMRTLAEKMKTDSKANYLKKIFYRPTLKALSSSLKALSGESIRQTFTQINLAVNEVVASRGGPSYGGIDVENPYPLEEACGQ